MTWLRFFSYTSKFSLIFQYPLLLLPIRVTIPLSCNFFIFKAMVLRLTDAFSANCVYEYAGSSNKSVNMVISESVTLSVTPSVTLSVTLFCSFCWAMRITRSSGAVNFIMISSGCIVYSGSGIPSFRHCVQVSDEDIANDNAYVWIEKELARVDQRAIDALGEKDILYVFPRLMGGKSSTRLVLKKPKTQSSERKVWIPKTLAYILRDWKEKQDRLKEFMGPDYVDYNLVLAQETGRPCEDRIIGNQFERLKKSAGLPNVVFHSLRHSSTTYKLKLNKGDLKATQGDTGHAQIDMITEIYAHILDEDRKVNAQKFEMAFYANPDMRPVEQKLQGEAQRAASDPDALMKQLEEKPQLMDAFTQKFIEQYGDQIMSQLAKKMMGV